MFFVIYAKHLITFFKLYIVVISPYQPVNNLSQQPTTLVNNLSQQSQPTTPGIIMDISRPSTPNPFQSTGLVVTTYAPLPTPPPLEAPPLAMSPIEEMKHEILKLQAQLKKAEKEKIKYKRKYKKSKEEIQIHKAKFQMLEEEQKSQGTYQKKVRFGPEVKEFDGMRNENRIYSNVLRDMRKSSQLTLNILRRKRDARGLIYVQNKLSKAVWRCNNSVQRWATLFPEGSRSCSKMIIKAIEIPEYIRYIEYIGKLLKTIPPQSHSQSHSTR